MSWTRRRRGGWVRADKITRAYGIVVIIPAELVRRCRSRVRRRGHRRRGRRRCCRTLRSLAVLASWRFANRLHIRLPSCTNSIEVEVDACIHFLKNKGATAVAKIAAGCVPDLWFRTIRGAGITANSFPRGATLVHICDVFTSSAVGSPLSQIVWVKPRCVRRVEPAGIGLRIRGKIERNAPACRVACRGATGLAVLRV